MPLNLGDINFGINVDDSSLFRSMTTIVRFGQEVERAAAKTSKGAAEAAAALRRQEAAALSALQRTLSFQQAVQNVKGPTELIRQSTQDFGNFINLMTKGQVSALSFQRAQEGMAARLGDLRRQLSAFNAVGDNAKVDKLAIALRDISSAATLTLGPLSGVGSRITALTNIIGRQNLIIAGAVAGFAAFTFGAVELGRSVIDTDIKINTFTQRLTAVTGNSLAAGAELDHLRDLASQTGTNFLTLAEEFGRFQAAAYNSALTGKDLNDVFDAFVQASGRLHLSAEETNRVLYALQQMLSIGKVRTQELLIQMGQTLPVAVSEFAKAMGVSTTALYDMLQKGVLLSDDVLPKVAKQLQQDFGGGAVQGLQADISRLANAHTYLSEQLDKALGIQSLYQAQLRLESELLVGLANNIDIIAGLFGALIGAVSGLIALRLAVYFIDATEALVVFAKSIHSITEAIEILNKTLTALFTIGGNWVSVLIKVGVAVAGAVAGFLLFRNAIDAHKQAVEGDLEAVELWIREQGLVKQSAEEAANAAVLKASIVVESTRAEVAALKAHMAAMKEMADLSLKAGDLGAAGTGFLVQSADAQKLESAMALLDRATNDLNLSLKGLKNATDQTNTSTAQLTDREQRAIDKVLEEIEANQQLGKALQKSAADGAAMQRVLSDTKAYDNVKRSLQEAKVPVEVISQLLQILKSSQQTKILGDIHAKFQEVNNDIARMDVVTKAMQSGGDLGQAFADQAKKATDLDKTLEDLTTQYAQITGSVAKARAEAEKYVDALRKQQKAEEDLAKFDVARDLGRQLSSAGAISQAAGTQFLEAGSSIAYLQRQAAREDALRQFSSLVIKAYGSADIGKQKIEAFSEALNTIESNTQAIGMRDLNTQLDRLQQELDTIPKGAEAVDRLKQSFEIEDQVKAVFNQVVEMTGDLDQAGVVADKFREKLIRLADSNDRLDGVKQLLQGLAHSLDSAIDSILDGGKSIDQIFLSILKDVERLIIKLTVVNPLLNQLTGATGRDALPVLNVSRLLSGGGQAAAGGSGGGDFGNPFSILGNIAGLGEALGNGVNVGGQFLPYISATPQILGASSSSGFFSSLFDFLAQGAAWSNGVRYAANGMVLPGATLFGSPSGPVIGGELGKDSEGLIPLARDSGGRLGVHAQGLGNRTTIVNMNVQTRDADSFNYSRSQTLSQLQAGLQRTQKRNG